MGLSFAPSQQCRQSQSIQKSSAPLWTLDRTHAFPPLHQRHAIVCSSVASFGGQEIGRDKVGICLLIGGAAGGVPAIISSDLSTCSIIHLHQEYHQKPSGMRFLSWNQTTLSTRSCQRSRRACRLAHAGEFNDDATSGNGRAGGGLGLPEVSSQANPGMDS